MQGHAPVLGPVNINLSSGLMVEDGAASPFWQLMQGFATNNGGKLHLWDCLGAANQKWSRF